MTPEDVPPPLGMFQGTRADKEDTLQMLNSINKAVSSDPVPEQALKKLFGRMWPDLEKEIRSMPAAEEKVPARRSAEDMFAEKLSMLRSQTRPDTELQETVWPEANIAGSKLRALSRKTVYPCPRCSGRRVAHRADGSAECLDCELVFAPGRPSQGERFYPKG